MDILQTIENLSPASDPARDRIRAIGRGISAIAGLAATMAGAPRQSTAGSASGASESGGSRRRRRPAGASLPDLQQRLAAARQLSSISLAERRERRAAGAALAKEASEAADRRQRRRADRRADLSLQLREESRREAAEARRTRPSRRSASTVTWIDPQSGESFTVERGVWDKSAHTLFGLVADSTRPEPDDRGYPSETQWRRRCYESYPSRSARDAFITENVSRAPRALDYLRRMTRHFGN